VAGVAGVAGAMGGVPGAATGGVIEAGGGIESAGVGGLGDETSSNGPDTVPPQYCSADGWCGSEMWISAVWGSSPADVWFLGVAAGSTIAFHGDGKSWETWRLVEVFNRPFDDTGPILASVWGSAEDDVWFGGGEIVHYDGSGFSSVPLYDEGDAEVPYPWIEAIWGSSGRDIWALENNTESRLVHYDGERWKRDPVRPEESLQALWGSGSSDVWAVGTGGCVLHFDGARWSGCDGVPRPTQSTLMAISGTAPDNVFVLSEARIVYHWDGARWRKRDLIVETPFPRSLWANSERFWVGTPGAIVSGGLSGELEFHETNPDAALGTGLWGFPTGEVWAIGGFGSSAFFDGARWSSFVRPNFDEGYYAFWAATPDSLWALGADRILHAQSGVWKTSHVAPSSQLAVIWGTSDENVWAAGGDIFHWDGTTWQRKNELPLQVSAIWGSSPRDVWAGGVGGELWRYTGETFVKVQSPTRYNLLSIWGTAADDVWLTAEADGPWHFDGKVWSEAKLAIDGTFHRPMYITGTSEADVWFLGWGGQWGPEVVHWNGAEWRVFEELPIYRTGWTPGSAWASGPCQIWLLGSQVDYEEQVAAFDGKDWRVERVGDFENTPVLTGASGELWIAGLRGTLMHRSADARSLGSFDCTAPAPKHPLACDPGHKESYHEPCGDCLTGSVTVSRLCGTDGRFQPWTRSGCVQTEPCLPDSGDDGI
jgi:hypothetical protein